MILDYLAGVFCGWVSLCLFALQAFGNPKHDRWMVMPWYVRVGLQATGTLFAVRSVNFLTLAPTGAEMIGHINLVGLGSLAALTYTTTALAVWSGFFKRLPEKGWWRLHWAEKEVRNGKVPLMAEPAEVEEMALKRGFHVNGRTPPIRREHLN